MSFVINQYGYMQVRFNSDLRGLQVGSITDLDAAYCELAFDQILLDLSIYA